MRKFKYLHYPNATKRESESKSPLISMNHFVFYFCLDIETRIGKNFI